VFSDGLFVRSIKCLKQHTYIRSAMQGECYFNIWMNIAAWDDLFSPRSKRVVLAPEWKILKSRSIFKLRCFCHKNFRKDSLHQNRSRQCCTLWKRLSHAALSRTELPGFLFSTRVCPEHSFYAELRLRNRRGYPLVSGLGLEP
jgi:hypothetical protein